jgi:hypothetical protein
MGIQNTFVTGEMGQDPPNLRPGRLDQNSEHTILINGHPGKENRSPKRLDPEMDRGS